MVALPVACAAGRCHGDALWERTWPAFVALPDGTLRVLASTLVRYRLRDTGLLLVDEPKVGLVRACWRRVLAVVSVVRRARRTTTLPLLLAALADGRQHLCAISGCGGRAPGSATAATLSEAGRV